MMFAKALSVVRRFRKEGEGKDFSERELKKPDLFALLPIQSYLDVLPRTLRLGRVDAAGRARFCGALSIILRWKL